MKSNINKFLLCSLVSLISFTSCELDLVSPENIAEENFWKTQKDAWYGLNAIYSSMPAFNMQREMECDNAHSHKPWEGPMEQLQMGALSPANDMGYDFTTIRLVNNFLEKIEGCALSDELKTRMKAEARFFRAQQYMELTCLFGKVPLVTALMNYDAPNVARDEASKVRQFVLDELQQAADNLPTSYKGGEMYETGRITKGAALAMRSRAALYFGNYQEAEKSAKAVMDLNKYALFTVNTLNQAQQKEAEEMNEYIDFNSLGINRDKFIKGIFSYTSLWHLSNATPKNPEYIITREYQGTENNYDWARYIYIRPSQLVTGYASFEPMHDLVASYWDIDGKTIRQDISVDNRKALFEQITSEFKDCKDHSAFTAKMATTDIMKFEYMKEFRNRDSRLYASILTPFKGWHETDKGTFYYWVRNEDIGKNGNEMWTGYAFRKMVSLESYDNWASPEDFPVFRYAEVLLTYAEARTFNTGYDSNVQKALNEIRDRCGMPNVPTSFLNKDEALSFIRNERRIELAGEGQRFFDIRRYGKEYCKKVMTGKTYAPNGYVVVTKGWKDNLMLMPIPQSAKDNNKLLDQNEGYN